MPQLANAELSFEYRHRKPDAAHPYWNVLPDDDSAVARQIAGYA